MNHDGRKADFYWRSHELLRPTVPVTQVRVSHSRCDNLGLGLSWAFPEFDDNSCHACHGRVLAIVTVSRGYFFRDL